jgi:riboflavin synthase
MFTGIIEEVGAVARRSGADMEIVAHKCLDGLHLGDSIAVNGACLTVAVIKEKSFVVQVSPETYARTTLGAYQPGDAVNLERAMSPAGRFGGHLVLGHVDGVGEVDGVQPQGEFQLWRFRAPRDVAKYLIPKGSVAIDGISLTVVEPRGGQFSVAIIPTTLRETTLSAKRAGDRVNLEADMIGKHVFHYLNDTASGLTREKLSRFGFD